MADLYFTLIAAELDISVWLLIVILLWSAVWKLIALWKSARNNSLIWFIVIAITNTVGILPILYIFVFSKMSDNKIEKVKSKKKKRKK